MARNYPGTCFVTRLEDGALRIERADALIWVSAELLEIVSQPGYSDRVSYGDGILTIRAVNGTVSYGVGERAPTVPTAFVAHRSEMVGSADGT